MAKGRKTGGKNFQKGHKFGKGRPPLPVEVKEIQRATRADMIRSFEGVMSMSVSELHSILTAAHAAIKEDGKSCQTGSLDAALAAIMLRAIMEGDHTRLSFVIDRLYGKPKPAEDEDPREHDDFLDTIPRSHLLKAAK